MDKLKVVTTFSGIGMQERGLQNTGLFELEIVNTCETDTAAIISYAAIHNGLTNKMVDEYQHYPSREEMIAELKEKNIGYDFVKKKEYNWDKLIKSKAKKIEMAWLACHLNKNVGDICLVESFPYCDLFTFSFPCTDLSVSGKQKGMIKGETRSGLVYEVIRILNNMKEQGNSPKYLLMENVAALVNKKNLPVYLKLNDEFEKIGYNCMYKILNAKFFGVPQNRDRVFALYIRKDIDFSDFEFPKEFDTGIRLKDVLLDKIPERYFVDNAKATSLIEELIKNGSIKE